MKNKFIILILTFTFTAASCNQIFFGGSGISGVIQSTDLGESFHDINKLDKKNNLNSTSVNTLVLDPANSSILYLGSSSGIYKSDSIGNSWKLIVTNILVTDLAIDPTDSNTMYVGGVASNHAKIIKSSDSASSWKDVYTEPTSSNAVETVAIDPNNHSTIYAGLLTGEVIKSTDSGFTWKSVTDLKDKILRIRFGPNRNPYVLTNTNGVYESKDGGNTFVGISDTLTNGLTHFGTNFSAVSKFLDLGFDQRQSGVIYLATEQGLVRTVDDGANWSYLPMPVRNTQLRTSSVAVSPADSNTLYATVGSTLFKSINGGVSWQTKQLISGQEVRMIVIDYNQPNVLYFGLGVRK